jgi:hypothetical protein
MDRKNLSKKTKDELIEIILDQYRTIDREVQRGDDLYHELMELKYPDEIDVEQYDNVIRFG